MHTTLQTRYNDALNQGKGGIADEIFNVCKDIVLYDLKEGIVRFSERDIRYILREKGKIDDVCREIHRGDYKKITKQFGGGARSIYEKIESYVTIPEHWTLIHVYALVECLWEGIDNYLKSEYVMPNIKIRKDGKNGDHHRKRKKRKGKK